MYIPAIHWLMYLEFFYFSRYKRYAVFSMQDAGILGGEVKGISPIEKQKICG
jgi:hypothetical protein